MNREVHVWICEGLGGKFPRPTRLYTNQATDTFMSRYSVPIRERRSHITLIDLNFALAPNSDDVRKIYAANRLCPFFSGTCSTFSFGNPNQNCRVAPPRSPDGALAR